MHTPVGFTPAHAMPDALPSATLVFAFRGDKILVKGDDKSPSVPTRSDFEGIGLAGPSHFLGDYEGVHCVASTLADDAADVEGFRYAGLRSLFFTVPEPLVAIAGRAFQVAEWDRTHRFCGRCGTPTRDKAGERAKECPACDYVAYPRVSPAMMALVTRGNELLLARANRFPPGFFSALAGFVEPGETIEDCIVREVREEVGLDVGRLHYFASQSWSFPHSLMIAFTAEYASGELRCDDSEIAEARWFSADALPPLPPSLSIARRLIDQTAARLRGE
ncbi:MAG TPA: NAD(+) diphosphatase [Casimicrobiaceae bacterium]|nr:NAD(+) diphosphatase [Casimicrobiaceae bacterium]